MSRIFVAAILAAVAIEAPAGVGWAKRSVPTKVAATWARREERAFAHPTSGFQSIGIRSSSNAQAPCSTGTGQINKIGLAPGVAAQSERPSSWSSASWS
jgi:hypothetical protein